MSTGMYESIYRWGSNCDSGGLLEYLGGWAHRQANWRRKGKPFVGVPPKETYR